MRLEGGVHGAEGLDGCLVFRVVFLPLASLEESPGDEAEEEDET